MCNNIFQSANLSILNNLNTSQNSISKNLQRMSSGLKILNSKDDASGVVISSKMNARLNGLNSVSGNIQRGMSFLNTAESAYTEISDILSRLRDLSLKASNETNDEKALSAINDEANELTNELKRIQTSTKFSDIKLFDNYIEESTTPTTPTPTPTPAPIATTSLDDEPIPMMMSMRATPQEYTVSFNIDETKTLNINGNEYKIQNGSGEIKNLVYTIEDNQINFKSNNFHILGNENVSHNVKISGNAIYFTGGKLSDKIVVSGLCNTIMANSGDDEIIIEGSLHNTIDVGKGNDKIIASANNLTRVTIMGDDYNTIEGLNNVNQSYMPAFSENKNYLFLNPGEANITKEIGGKIYTFSASRENQAGGVCWEYDEANDKVIFAGANVIITGEDNIVHNVDVHGNQVTFRGGNLNDKINLVSGWGMYAFGNDGNDIMTSQDGLASATLDGGNGDDVITGNCDYGRYVGGEGNDSITLNSCTVDSGTWYVQDGGEGNDSYEINTSISIEDTSGNNSYYVNTSDVTLNTGTSNDTFYINADDVKVNTTGGDNKFIINGSNNKITSADGNDEFEIVGNNNQIDGGTGENKVKSEGNNTYQNISEIKTKTSLNITLQVGAEAGQSFDIDLDFSLAGFNLDFSSSQGARNNISKIDNLIDEVNMELSKIGATMNRLESAIQLQEIETTNLSQTKSLITDCDMSNEAVELVKNNILSQVSSAIFTQANQQSSNYALSLLNFNF